eukprot:756694-Hanusia_phi.AAC.4
MTEAGHRGGSQSDGGVPTVQKSRRGGRRPRGNVQSRRLLLLRSWGPQEPLAGSRLSRGARDRHGRAVREADRMGRSVGGKPAEGRGRERLGLKRYGLARER